MFYEDFLLSDSLSFIGESDEYLEPDGYMEEEELIPGEDVLSDTINPSQHQLKIRQIFRVPRERQRGKRKDQKDSAIRLKEFTVLSLNCCKLKDIFFFFSERCCWSAVSL